MGNHCLTQLCGHLVGVETRVWDLKTQSRFIALVAKLTKAHREAEGKEYFEQILKSLNLTIKGKNLYIDEATEEADRIRRLQERIK